MHRITGTHHWYRKRSSGVPNGLNDAIGTRNTLLVYRQGQDVTRHQVLARERKLRSNKGRHFVLPYAGFCKSITKSEVFFFIPVRFGVWLAVGLSGVCLQPNRKEFIVHLVNALLACHDLPVDQSLDCSLHS